MRLTKVKDADRILEMHIEDEDLALADILHHELLNDREVVFAGVIPTHPLMKKTALRVQTKEIKPIDAVVANSVKAAENAGKILSETKKTIEGKAGKADDYDTKAELRRRNQ